MSSRPPGRGAQEHRVQGRTGRLPHQDSMNISLGEHCADRERVGRQEGVQVASHTLPPLDPTPDPVVGAGRSEQGCPGRGRA